jgi:ribosomal subunit interface protein
MNVEIRSLHIDHADSLREHAERRVESAIRRFGDRIVAVQIRLADLNGPRGGIDKLCRIQVHGRGLNIVVEDKDIDAFVAVDRAAHRLRRALDRRLESGARAA